MTYDYKKLRKDLIDYFGTAAFSGFPAAMMDVYDVEKASNEKLLEYAKQAGFNMSKYKHRC